MSFPYRTAIQVRENLGRSEAERYLATHMQEVILNWPEYCPDADAKPILYNEICGNPHALGAIGDVFQHMLLLDPVVYGFIKSTRTAMALSEISTRFRKSGESDDLAKYISMEQTLLSLDDSTNIDELAQRLTGLGAEFVTDLLVSVWGARPRARSVLTKLLRRSLELVCKFEIPGSISDARPEALAEALSQVLRAGSLRERIGGVVPLETVQRAALRVGLERGECAELPSWFRRVQHLSAGRLSPHSGKPEALIRAVEGDSVEQVKALGIDLRNKMVAPIEWPEDVPSVGTVGASLADFAGAAGSVQVLRSFFKELAPTTNTLFAVLASPDPNCVRAVAQLLGVDTFSEDVSFQLALRAANFHNSTHLQWILREADPRNLWILLPIFAGLRLGDAVLALSEVGLDRACSELFWAGRGAVSALLGGGATAMLVAIRGRQKDLIESLMTLGAAHGARGVVRAACRRSPELALRLIEAGADVNFPSAHGPPLHAAVERGQTAVVEALIAAGADVKATDHYGPALARAILGGKLEIVERLLAAGSDPNAVERRGVAMIALARKLRQGGKIVAALKQAGAVDPPS